MASLPPRAPGFSPSTDVTVVIPTRNRPELVRRAAAFALAQGGVSLEVVVIDDGSSAPLTFASDPALRVLRQPTSQGVAAARNRGIDEARGRWIAFLDDDDLWAPHKLASQVAAMEQSGSRWCASGAVTVTQDLEVRFTTDAPPPPVGLAELWRGNVLGSPSGVIVETALLREVGGFDDRFSVFADWELWLRLAHVAPAWTVTAADVGYMTHPGSMHRQAFKTTADELLALAAHYRATTGHELDLAPMWRWLGISQVSSGQVASGLATLLRTAIRSRQPTALADALRPAAERLRAMLGRKRPAPAWLEAVRSADGPGAAEA